MLTVWSDFCTGVLRQENYDAFVAAVMELIQANRSSITCDVFVRVSDPCPFCQWCPARCAQRHALPSYLPLSLPLLLSQSLPLPPSLSLSLSLRFPQARTLQRMLPEAQR
jgi:hypothetical protein